MISILLILMVNHLIASNYLFSRQLFNSAIKECVGHGIKKHAFILSLIKHMNHSLL